MISSKYPYYFVAICSLWILAGLSGQAENPGHFFVERVESTPLAQTTKIINPPPARAPLAQGESFIDPESGHRITRISEINQIENWSVSNPPDGDPAQGVTNGYSKYTNVNVTGEYAIAWASLGNHNGLYRLADYAYMGYLDSSVVSLGETNDVRWDLSGRPGTEYDIIYAISTKVCRQNVLEGKSSEQVIYDFGIDIWPEDHMDQDIHGRYRAVRLSDQTTAVLDMIEGNVLPVTLHSGGLDISPQGRWLYLGGTTPVRFYDIEALALGDTTHFAELPTTSHGHDGWAFDKDGNEVYIFQDNKNDMFSAFNPATNERIDIINMGELGWGLNQHLSRMLNPAQNGWLLMSTYCMDNSSWAYNQLMMIEILPAEQKPRIWHIAMTYNNRWVNGMDIGGYFSEAFASISPDGNSIYWGANWMAQDNLELYRVDMPENWHEYLAQHDGNTAPGISGPVSKTANAGETISFDITGSDIDGDTLGLEVDNLPSGATFTPGNPATFEWTPQNTDHGVHRITFRMSDGIYTSSQTVMITVLATAPPEAPGGVAGEAKSDSEIALAWNEATDIFSTVTGYNIYRDGELAGHSNVTGFIMSGLSENTACTFTIRSVNESGLESVDSAPVTVTTLLRTSPPAIESIETYGDNNRIEVFFDVPLDPASAQQKSNYRIEPAIEVEKAILSPHGKSVLLQTSPHIFDRTYKLTVVGIKDQSISANATDESVWRRYMLEALAPSNYLIEHVESLAADKTTKIILSLPASDVPAQGVPFIQTQTGHRITRISDVHDIEHPNAPYLGKPNRGVTNGYSKYTNVNLTGEYAIAWATENGHNGLYRLSDASCLGELTSSGGWLGETSDARWDLSGQPGTEYDIIYHVGSRLLRQNVLEGVDSEVAIHDFGVDLIHEGHMDQDAQARYRAVRLANSSTVVIDLREGRVLPPVLEAGGADISPMGKWLYLGGTNPVRFYDIDALAMGDTSVFAELPTTSHGHDGWAFDSEGNEVYVFQDNKNDWFSAFNPATNERIDIINMNETGWSINQHMGRIMNPIKKGWLLLSTYCRTDDVWANNQLMLIEIKPSAQSPRIWRIASTYNRRWINDEDVGGYFAESFASIDKAGNNIYWGGNWMAEGNLELYRVELPQNWHEVLMDETQASNSSVGPEWTSYG